MHLEVERDCDHTRSDAGPSGLRGMDAEVDVGSTEEVGMMPEMAGTQHTRSLSIPRDSEDTGKWKMEEMEVEMDFDKWRWEEGGGMLERMNDMQVRCEELEEENTKLAEEKKRWEDAYEEERLKRQKYQARYEEQMVETRRLQAEMETSKYLEALMKKGGLVQMLIADPEDGLERLIGCVTVMGLYRALTEQFMCPM